MSAFIGSVFVERKEGAIVGVYANRQPDYAEEELAENHPDVVAFRNPPPPVPPVISDRQFAHALWKSSLITFDEAMAFVQTGTIPAAIAAGIAAIPDETQRMDTQLLVAGATEYRRDNAAVAALATVLGWSAEQIDAIWTLGASL